jgi:two-component system cell cycle sensor histidine kinase/response regulator CckA
MLGRQGFRVITAQNAPEALELCRQRQGAIDLVLSDLAMPQMSGEELGVQIRHHYPQMKLVFMSGYAEQRIVTQIASDPEMQFVSKPFTSAALITALHKALGRTGQLDA